MDISFAWLFCVVFLAHFTESVLGFGCGLLVLALASYPLNILLPVLIPLNIVLSLSILTRDRRAVSPILLRQMLPWAGLGLPLGFTLILSSLSNTSDSTSLSRPSIISLAALFNFSDQSS